MKRILLLFTVIGFLASCGGVKKTQEALNTGNYVQAIHKSVNNLADNKTKKGHQAYVILLEEAFKKHQQRELQQISFLSKDGNPANLEKIYRTYQELKGIQDRIAPLLPLPIYEENRNAAFDFQNYDNDIIAVKEDLSEYLYDNANRLLAGAKYKVDFRQAYEDFRYLEEINPGYADIASKMDEAYHKGLDYVKVSVLNDTEQIVPKRLEEELLNFNTFGLDDLWTAYHNNPQKGINYDYEMLVAFRNIAISPEQINERQIIKEKQIKDGKELLLDENGNTVKDSLGNNIEIDRLKTVSCNFYQFTQHKTAVVSGNVSFVDLSTKQQLNSYPLSSQFVFEHIYANYDGDRRALDNDLVALLDLARVPFPSDEQMVYDAGEDLKLKLKSILTRHRFN